MSRKQVLVLAGVVLVLVVASVGYQYHRRWHGNRPQPQSRALPQFQGKAILDPPLQDLLLPYDTVIENRWTLPGGDWSVFIGTDADWDDMYGRLYSFLTSRGFELDPVSGSMGGLGARRWNSPDRQFFVHFMHWLNSTDELPKAVGGGLTRSQAYTIGVFYENPVKPKLPSPEEEEP